MTEQTADGTMPTEQPAVTRDTKFRRGGFKPAAEVIAEEEEKRAAPTEAQPNGAEAEEENLMREMLANDTSGAKILMPGEEETPEPTEVPAAAPVVQQAARIKIGGKEFASQEEAWTYAESLEQERIAADAFRQGVEAASKLAPSNPAPQSAAPPEPQEIDPEYYTNPQAYFAKREAQIVARATQAVQQVTAQKESHDNTWSQFYADYPDLTHMRELVDVTLQQNWNTLQHVETKAALKQLADKTRAKLKPFIEANTPKVTLPKVAAAVTPGGSQTVTPTKTPAKPLSFVQQVKQNKKGKAQLR